MISGKRNAMVAALIVSLVLAGCGAAPRGGTSDEASADSASFGDAPIPIPATTSFNSTPRPPSCAGMTAKRRGLTQRAMTVAGLNRTYLVYLPPHVNPNAAIPLVYVAHGFTMSGQAMHDITRYSELADREGIAVAFPDGETGPNSLGPPWNVGTGVCGLGALVQASGDDVSFMKAIKADIASDQCLDNGHVFMTGFSMGGFFSHEIGCDDPDLARAIAPHSGGTHPFTSCVPGHKPVIMFHGTGDIIIDVNCGKQARDEWVAKNGCGRSVVNQPVTGGHCEWSLDCPADGQVVLCLFDNMPHAWAGGTSGQLFSDPTRARATDMTWAFFRKFAW